VDDEARPADGRSLPPQVRELLQASGDARDRAWSEFLKTYSRLILFVARRTSSDYDTVMDRYTYAVDRLAEQDCRRLRAYTADGRAKFTTWLTIVVRRLCLDAGRRDHRDPTSGELTGAASGPDGFDRLARLVPITLADTVAVDRGPNPDESLRRRERDDALKAAIAALPDSDQFLLALRFEDGLSAPEIARLAAFPTPFHVYRSLNRVMGALRERLKRSGIEGSTP